MAGKPYPVIQKNLELRKKAVEANREELPHLEESLAKIDGLLTDVKDLTAQQASLAASKQDVSKRLAERMREGESVIAFVAKDAVLAGGMAPV